MIERARVRPGPLVRGVQRIVRRLADWRHGARVAWIEAAGERIAVGELGDEDAPTIVLVHGLRGEIAASWPLGVVLARHGYRVLCPELPGHGRTPPPSTPLTILRAAEIVGAAIERVCSGSAPLLAGHSMGGWISALVALDAPGLVGRLALLGSAGIIFDPPPVEILLPTSIKNARRSLSLLFARPPRVPALALYITSRRPIDADYDLLESAVAGEQLLEERLGALRVPTIVIWGAKDCLIPPETGRRMASLVPGQRYVELPEAGHMLIWEEADAVARQLVEFDRERGAPS